MAAIMNMIEKVTKECKRCGSTVTREWWKCCRKHTSQNGPDVLCEECALILHPGYSPSAR